MKPKCLISIHPGHFITGSPILDKNQNFLIYKYCNIKIFDFDYPKNNFNETIKFLSNKVKELSKKYEVAHIFLPDFVRRFKANIPGEVNPLQKNFESIAESKFLIIDDIGAEHISQWSMNEILLNILQRRNNKNKFTIFTSNYKLDQLKQRYLKATNDYVGTDRVIERIKRITEEREMI